PARSLAAPTLPSTSGTSTTTPSPTSSTCMFSASVASSTMRKENLSSAPDVVRDISSCERARMALSIRTRLTVWYSALLLLGLVTFIVVVLLVQWRLVVREYDESLDTLSV